MKVAHASTTKLAPVGTHFAAISKGDKAFDIVTAGKDGSIFLNSRFLGTVIEDFPGFADGVVEALNHAVDRGLIQITR